LSLVAATISATGPTLNRERIAAFAGGDENAVVDGDCAVTESELRTALKSLREAGINIVAIHSHMTGDEPRVIFFHYWGHGPAQSLAQSVQKDLPAITAMPPKSRPSVR
jgi:Domain of Unknown Function (DUF1259)